MKSSEVNVASGVACLVGKPDSDDRIAVPACLLAIVSTILLGYFNATWYWYFGTWVLAFAAIGSVSWKALVDPDHRVVREEARLYGVKLLARRTLPFGEYEAVVIEHIKTTDDDDWRVGLQHRSGRKVWMRRYIKNDPRHSNPEFAASSFAMALSETMNLPIQDLDSPDPGQWLRRVKLRRIKK